MKKLRYLLLAMAAIAAFACQKPDDGGIEDPTLGLVLSASKNYISADGVDKVEFGVKMNGLDVTAEADIYQFLDGKSTKITGKDFSSEKKLDYKFYAIYDGNISPKISVTAVTKLFDLPADSDKNDWSFERRALAVQGTSVGCAFCPRVMQIIHDFKKSDYADKLVFASAHCNISILDPMTSEGGLYMITYLGMSTFPALILDYKLNITNIANVKALNSAAESRISTAAKCGISATVNDVDGQICVDVQVKNAEEGMYRIGALLLEDGIYFEQYDGTGIITDSNREEMYNHNDAIRAMYPYSEAEGVMLGDAKLKAQSRTSFHCEFTANKSYVENIENCHVVIYVIGEDKTIDNVIDCPVGGSVAYQYK